MSGDEPAATTDTTTMMADDSDIEQDYNLLNEPARIVGLVLMSLSLALAVYLMAWTFWHRTSSPVVKAMQPAFLVMLPFGAALSLLSIVPLGLNEYNTANINAACISFSWLESLGDTVVLIALVAKLWRLNQVFHAAETFQRKVVTVKDVLWPFSILLLVNLVSLIVQTVVDPYVWKRDPIEDDSYGYCTSKNAVGFLMEFLRKFANLIALLILCVQAYRARGIKTDFSEARGVALSLFVRLEASILFYAAFNMFEKSNTSAKYILQVLFLVSIQTSMLLFIFGPIVAKERQRLRRSSTTTSAQKIHVSGLEQGTQDITGSATAMETALSTTTNSAPNTLGNNDVDYPSVVNDLNAALLRISSLESRLQAVQSRNEQLEGYVASQH